MCVSSVELPWAEVTAKEIREDLSGRRYRCVRQVVAELGKPERINLLC